jgi:hypothetical protein
MLTPGYSITATERILPSVTIDFTTGATDARVVTTRALNTATRTNSSGALEIVNANLPRYDFSPVTLLCRGQLIEESRVNRFLNSLIDGTSLATQSVTLTAAAQTLSFYGTGSVVISGGHSATVTGTGAYPTRTTYTFTPTAGSSTFTVSGTVQYAQIEAGAFATSFIPTAGAVVTRNADAVGMTGTNFSSWFNATEGTFEAEYSCYVATNVSNSKGILAATDGTTGNRLYMNINTTGTPFFFVSASSSTQANISTTVTLVNDAVARTTGAYKLNSFAAAANGTLGTPDTVGNVPVVNRLDIGSLLTSPQLNGHFRKLMYWPQRITNGETQAFSKG